MLLANDSDYKRTHMLVHQTSRMPSKGLIVTNNDACESSSVADDRLFADCS
jgi:16S rRNA C967 or C1407 C5-methylase (RsmB/RsmF family)